MPVDLPISTLPTATSVADSDIDVVVQGGVTKKAAFSIKKDYYQGKGAGGRILVASPEAPSYVIRRADIKATHTDDDGDINSALADGNVEMSDGDFQIHEKIVMNYPGHALVGAGKGVDMTGAGGGSIGRGRGTRLLLLTGFADAAAIEVAQTGATRPVGGALLRDFLIEGGNFGTNVDGIHYRGFQSLIENVHVRRMTRHGINCHGYTAAEIGNSNGWSNYDTRITGVWCEANAGAGLYFQNGTDIVVSESWFLSNAGSGFHHDGGASVQMSNCHSYGNAINAVHLEGAGTRDLFSNCKFQHSDQHGIHFNGSGGAGTGQTSVQFNGCDIGMSGQQTNNVYSHFKFTGTGQHGRCRITNCNFHNADAATNKAQYAIDLGGSVIELQLIGNNFGTTASQGGWVTSVISFTGTANFEARGNIGLRDHHSAIVAAPTVVAGSGAGTSPTVAIGTGIACNDDRGSVTVTTGTGTTGTANDLFTVTYDVPLAVTGSTVHIEGANVVSANLIPVVTANDNNGFTVRCGVSPALSTAYAFRYIVMG